MTYTRITIPLAEPEMNALRELARRDLRQPKDQARFILRSALGLTTSDGAQKKVEGSAKVSSPAATL